MAIQTIHGGLIIPPLPTDAAGAPGIGNQAVDAVGEKVALVFQAPKTGNIRKLAFFARTIGGATDWVFDVRIETVSLTAFEPTGVLWNNPTDTTNTTLTVGSGADNTWITTPALTADAAVVAGEYVAAVFNVTTAGSAGSFEFQRFIDGDWEIIRAARSLTDTGAGYGSLAGQQHLGIGVEYDDGTYIPIFDVRPIKVVNTTNVGNAAAVRRFALRFKLLAPSRINMAWFWVDADGDFDLILYDSDGSSELLNVSIDKDRRGGTDAAPTVYQFAPISLAKDTFYRMAVVPSSATTCAVYDQEVESAAVMDALFGGQNFHLSTHNGTSWANTLTKQPFAGIGLNGFDDGVGGGGGGGGSPLHGPF